MANYTSTHTGATIDASVTIVSGSGVTQSDLTKLNAVTSSAVELNILDGVTASTAEINILDGLTATTAELNYLDGADSSITTLSLPDNTTITTFGASLIDDADAATARTTLGVDVAGTDNSTDVTLVTTSHDYLSISGQAITLGSIDISDDTNLTGGTGITLTGDTLSTTDSEIVHDNLSGFVANEHIDHSTVSISAGSGLSGGGDLTSTRTLSIDSSVVTLSATQTLSNKSISGTANTISNVHIVDDTINTLTIARGGTGGTTSAEARSNLNVDVAGTDNSTDVTLVTTSHDYLSLSGQEITLGEIDISDDTNLVDGTGITLTGDTLSTTDSEIVHDNLSGFVSNEHIDHSTVSITAGTGLSGGGDITTSRTLTTDDSAIVHDDLSGFVANEHIDHSGVSITAGAGLTGGGDITATRDIAVGAGTGVTVNADDIAIGQDVGTNADVTFNSVTSDDFIGSLNGAVQFEAKATVALNKGDAVYVVGISGNTPTIALADANDATKMPSFGLAASSASIDDVIEVVTFGTLRNINTSSFSEGDILFVSSNGTAGNTLTATKEGGESVLCQNIGKVIRSHATVGSIKVGGAGRANATPNLNDGNIFIGNGSNEPVTAALNTKIEDYLDGGTSTANFDTISVDGAEITATPAELNVLDGITSTTAELNYTDGVTSNIQTQLDLKAPLASPAFTGTATGANLTLSGDLTVNGSTTTLDTTNLAVEDNLMELNAGVTSNANDSGFLIERGSTGDNAIFMWDESADKFTLGTTTATGTTTGDITLSSTGTLVANVEGDVTGAVTGNADTATTLATARNFSLTGDVTAGAVSFDGSGNVALSTTIAANSVALGTDTTGNYMSDLTEGTGIDISHTPGEGSNGTITLDLTEVGFGGGANRLITDDGDGTVSTEANLTFDGSTLALTGDLNVGSGDFFVDDSAGRVGIGTASPGTKLEVKAAGDTSQEVIKIRNSSGTEVMTIAAIDSGGDGYINFNTSPGTINTNGGHLVLSPGGSGNVGIGTASPEGKVHIYNGDASVAPDGDADELVVENSADSGISILSGESNGHTGSLIFGSASDAFAAGVVWDYYNKILNVKTQNSSGILRFASANNSEAMRILANGNVGIGTDSPSSKLDLGGSTSGQRITFSNTGVNTTNGARTQAEIGYKTGSYSGAAVIKILTETEFDDSMAVAFHTGSSAAETMRIDSNQNVGIGTDSPSVKLHINDNDVLIGNNSSGYATLNFHSATTGSARYASIMKNYDSPFDMRIRASNSTAEAPLVFDGDSNTEYARFDTSGNFGIGTDSPSALLDVAGNIEINNSSDPTLTFQEGSLTKAQIVADNEGSAGGSLEFFTRVDGGSSTEKMRISAAGNVGIGASSNINERLYVYHSSSADVLGVVGVGNAGSTNFANINFRNLYSSATGDSAIIGCDTGSTTDKGELVFSTSGGGMNATEKMRITSGGNVGIGVTNPSFSYGSLGLEIQSTGDTSLRLERDGSTAFEISARSSDVLLYNVGTARAIRFGIAGGEVARIATNGNMIVGSNYTTNASTKLVVSHSGANGILLNNDASDTANSGRIFFEGTSTSAIFQEGNDLSFRTGATTGSSSGTERLALNTDGDLLPGADGTQDLGSNTKRWGVIYSADLDLSNEGSENDVDGTWGSYVIQEGEDDLFLINRRSGKKYKFMLQEVQD